MDRITSRRAQALLAATLALGLVPVVHADETLMCNATITSVPYTITTQGHYCFDRNLSTAQTAGAAITINADFVTLDLNGFKLGGGAAGPATLTTGVAATDRKNLVIRNGNIRGFRSGIFVGGTASKAVIVENIRLDENTTNGIVVFGNNHVLRDNSVSDTGGNTTGSLVTGIAAFGESAQVINNAVLHTFDNSANSGLPIAIWGGHGGGAPGEINMLIVNNRVADSALEGIDVDGSVCRDNIVTQVVGPAIACTVLVGTTNYP